MKMHLLVTFILIAFCSSLAEARDQRNRYSIEEAMNTADAKSQLNRGYTFRFGDSDSSDVVENHGEFQSNKKTNSVGKSDEFACQWAFLSAMLTFQDRIASEGGNAVINIHSYYKKHDFVSETEFECGNGTFVSGVTFKGDVVTLKE